MSHILTDWLNKEIKLSKSLNPKYLDEVFKNGFFFGEVLDKLNITRDFKNQFTTNSSYNSCLRNYTHLEEILP